MGAEGRESVPDLDTAAEQIEQHAKRYSFYKLVYKLERLHPNAPPVGQTGPAADERVRLRGDTSLVFHSSDIHGVDLKKKYGDDVERAQVTTTFMSLYGSTSPLPAYFVEQFAQNEYQGREQPIREFLDVFHHRLLSLVYRSWSKYRFGVRYLKGGADTFTQRMFCTVGLDGFRQHDTPIDRFLFLRYAPLLAAKSRSVRGLNVVLDDLFGTMGVKIRQFVGHWTLIEKPYRNKVGVMNHQLGQSLTIGKWIFDGSGRYTIILGPLGYDEYLSFLPGGHRRPMLRGVCSTFTRGMYDVMLELHVKTDAAPRFQLAAPRASTMGRTAWLGGSGGQPFVITVPLDEPSAKPVGEDDDDDGGEPPPMLE